MCMLQAILSNGSKLHIIIAIIAIISIIIIIIIFIIINFVTFYGRQILLSKSNSGE
jgi:hypothetical protein